MTDVKWVTGTVVRATSNGPRSEQGYVAGGCGLVCDLICDRGEDVWWLIHLETGHAICHWSNFTRRKAMKAATPIVAGFDWSFKNILGAHRFDAEALARLRSVLIDANAQTSGETRRHSAKIAAGVRRARAQVSQA